VAKVRFIQTLSTFREVYLAGSTAELSAAEAESYVRNGVAEAVEEDPTPEEVKEALHKLLGPPTAVRPKPAPKPKATKGE
jgi:hypothetical protein